MPAQILVVDDDAETLGLVARVLSVQGYEVWSATNGAEAFAEIDRRGVPDVILLDLMMPVMSGWEFCHHRDADPALAAVPVVLMSAEDNLGRAPRSSTAQHLSKPFELSALRFSVQRALQGPPFDEGPPGGAVH